MFIVADLVSLRTQHSDCADSEAQTNLKSYFDGLKDFWKMHACKVRTQTLTVGYIVILIPFKSVTINHPLHHSTDSYKSKYGKSTILYS